MIVGENAREYVARVKGLARAMEYHGIGIAEEKIRRRTRNAPPPRCKVFAVKYEFSLFDLEQALVNVEALHKQRDGADGHTLAAGFSISEVDKGVREVVIMAEVVVIERVAGVTAEVISGSRNSTTSRHHRHIYSSSRIVSNRQKVICPITHSFPPLEIEEPPFVSYTKDGLNQGATELVPPLRSPERNRDESYIFL